MILAPLPVRANDVFKARTLWLPTQNLASFIGIRHHPIRVARSRRLDADRNRSFGHASRGLDHLEHRVPFAVAKVDERGFASCIQVLERQNVRDAKISHVNVVPYRSTVGRW